MAEGSAFFAGAGQRRCGGRCHALSAGLDCGYQVCFRPLGWLHFANTGRKRHCALSAHRVDITLSDGRGILVEGPTALSAVLSLVEGVMS